MATPPRLVDAYVKRFGETNLIHTALPPFHQGGELVDVAEFPQPDGTTRYITAGLTTGNPEAHELMLHASAMSPRLVELMAQIGGSTRHRRYVHGATLPLAGPATRPPPFDGLGFFFSERLPLAEGTVAIDQVFGLTSEEIAAARVASLYTVEAALRRDGRGRLSEMGRTTTESLAAMMPVYPPEHALAHVSGDAREVVDIAIHVDHEAAESIRGLVSETDARHLGMALFMLPHPAQLAVLLHALMDHPVQELEPVALNLLEQCAPDDPMAPQYYADALAAIDAVGGADHWETYVRYEGDLDAALARRAELLD